MVDDENKSAIAINLCMKIGAIEECEDHDGEYIDSMEYSDEEELTTEILKDNPQALNDFSSRKAMVEYIADVLNHAAEECPVCARYRDS
jgi:hypothetical protein